MLISLPKPRGATSGDLRWKVRKIIGLRVFDVSERLLLARDPRLPVGVSIGHVPYRQIFTPFRVRSH